MIHLSKKQLSSIYRPSISLWLSKPKPFYFKQGFCTRDSSVALLLQNDIPAALFFKPTFQTHTAYRVLPTAYQNPLPRPTPYPPINPIHPLTHSPINSIHLLTHSPVFLLASTLLAVLDAPVVGDFFAVVGKPVLVRFPVVIRLRGDINDDSLRFANAFPTVIHIGRNLN